MTSKKASRQIATSSGVKKLVEGLTNHKLEIEHYRSFRETDAIKLFQMIE